VLIGAEITAGLPEFYGSRSKASTEKEEQDQMALFDDKDNQSQQ
jgi:hypothetical protein